MLFKISSPKYGEANRVGWTNGTIVNTINFFSKITKTSIIELKLISMAVSFDKVYSEGCYCEVSKLEIQRRYSSSSIIFEMFQIKAKLINKLKQIFRANVI